MDIKKLKKLVNLNNHKFKKGMGSKGIHNLPHFDYEKQLKQQD